MPGGHPDAWVPNFGGPGCLGPFYGAGWMHGALEWGQLGPHYGVDLMARGHPDAWVPPLGVPDHWVPFFGVSWFLAMGLMDAWGSPRHLDPLLGGPGPLGPQFWGQLGPRYGVDLVAKDYPDAWVPFFGVSWVLAMGLNGHLGVTRTPGLPTWGSWMPGSLLQGLGVPHGSASPTAWGSPAHLHSPAPHIGVPQPHGSAPQLRGSPAPRIKVAQPHSLGVPQPHGSGSLSPTV